MFLLLVDRFLYSAKAEYILLMYVQRKSGLLKQSLSYFTKVDTYDQILYQIMFLVYMISHNFWNTFHIIFYCILSYKAKCEKMNS